MDQWLTSAADAVAGSAGVDRGRLELSRADVETLLDLARVAAHESGARSNAPLLCYLVGLARGSSGSRLEHVAAAVPRAGG
ncbi:MAG: DUF6457 domain-containing protein [Gaiellaceae bacterium]